MANDLRFPLIQSAERIRKLHILHNVILNVIFAVLYCIHTDTVKPALSKPVYISTNQITGFV